MQELLEPFECIVVVSNEEKPGPRGSWCGGECMSMSAVHFID